MGNVKEGNQANINSAVRKNKKKSNSWIPHPFQSFNSRTNIFCQITT